MRRILRWLGYAAVGATGATLWTSVAGAGQLEDLLLENKQITIDQWVRLKAEEEKREAQALEESRGVGDTPVKERWYERFSIRGYTQFRYNHNFKNELLTDAVGDRSIGKNEFFLRRARLIFSGQPHDRVFVYFQPEFAGVVNGGDAENRNVPVMRDWYADLYLTENKEWRIRAGQSKVPFTFDNVQSSQNRLPLDRTMLASTSAFNERDLGVFLYYAPASVRERFRRLVNSGLKGSGDYGMLGIGVYNGQTANKPDENKNKHVVFHAAYPHEFANGQIFELGMDAYTGQFVVSTAPVVPLNPAVTGGVPATPFVTNQGNYLDERVAWHFVLYPQPFGIQGEFLIGRGPVLNSARTEIVEGAVRGGSLQVYYNYRCDTFCLAVFPYARYQEYFGGVKHEPNAPPRSTREFEVGLEYQFNQALELTIAGTWTSRASADPDFDPAQCVQASGGGVVPCIQTPYQRQSDNLLRFQLQWSF